MCPLCRHQKSAVLRTTYATAIVRVRRCAHCGHKWRTEEIDADTAKRAREVLERVRELAGTVL